MTSFLSYHILKIFENLTFNLDLKVEVTEIWTRLICLVDGINQAFRCIFLDFDVYIAPRDHLPARQVDDNTPSVIYG